MHNRFAGSVVPLLLSTFIGVIIFASGGCRTQEYVRAKFWSTDPIGTSTARTFPEREDGPLKVARAASPEHPVGVCFAGGGIRSATATLGQLRGLHETGLIDQVGYISCVSGGSWSAVPYTFYPGEAAELLGPYREPKAVKPEDLEKPSSKLGSALSNTELPSWFEAFGRAIFSVVRLRDNEWFGKQLDKRILVPLGIGGRDRFVTQNTSSRAAIKSRNGHLDDDDFLLPHAERPFLIVNGTLRRYHWWPWEVWSNNRRMPIEMTPLYVGLPHRFQDLKDGRSVGGTYVEPLAYGADDVELAAGEPGTIKARLRNDLAGVESQRFNLVDMITISGSAPAEFQIMQYVAFPEMPSWSVSNRTRVEGQKKHEKIDWYAHADGGLSENLGMMSLLARRVPCIIAFVNAESGGVPNYVRELFGHRTDEYVGWHSRGVFPAEKLHDLELAMSKCSAGGTPFHLDTYRVHGPSNDDGEDKFNLHLTPGEVYEVKVAWFFLESTAWYKELHAVNQPLGDYMLGHSNFKNFPRYKTFLNHGMFIIDPTTRQVEALAHMTSWLVVQHGDDVRRYFGIKPPAP